MKSREVQESHLGMQRTLHVPQSVPFLRPVCPGVSGRTGLRAEESLSPQMAQTQQARVVEGTLFLLFHQNPPPPVSRSPLPVQSLALALSSCKGSVRIAHRVVPEPSGHFHINSTSPNCTRLLRGARVPIADQLPELGSAATMATINSCDMPTINVP